MASWLDKTHQAHPEIKIAISEYGAGASIYHQQDSLVQTSPGSWWHPENWQTEYHIQNWKIISERPYVWGSFVWNMFDFGAAHRTEGDRPGINDKGLVTHDRKVKKDAFYFYKGQIIKKMQPDGVKVCIFKDIRLKKGENNIEVSAKNGKRVITDACCWIL